MTVSTDDPRAASPAANARTDGRPGPGLGHEDGPPCAQPLERVARRIDGDPLAEGQPTDRRDRPQQGGRVLDGRPGQVALDRIEDRPHVGDAADPQVGRGVEPLAPGGQVAQAPDRIAAGDQRPDVRGATQSLGEDLRSAIEPDRATTAEQGPPVARIDDGPAAAGDDPADGVVGVRWTEPGDRGSLHRPEGRLAVLLEDRRDRASLGLLDDLVEVDVARAVALREASSDDALAAPGQPDEHEVHQSIPSAHGDQSSPPEPASSVPRVADALGGALIRAW